jgi:AAA domain
MLYLAGRLVLAKIRRHHFTHVFIDECASSTETSSLIPIAGITFGYENLLVWAESFFLLGIGIITTDSCISGQVVLAGDIKQLGPIVQSRPAESLGYGKLFGWVSKKKQILPLIWHLRMDYNTCVICIFGFSSEKGFFQN